MPVSSSLDRPILRLALPSLIASLSVPLIGIADTALVGHLPEVALMGAVSVASVIFDVLYWGFGFFRMGTTSLVAQYFGSGDREASARVLMQSMWVAVGIGVGLILLHRTIADLGFAAASPGDEVELWGRRYFAIRILGAPFVLVTYVLIGFFRGCADAVSPLWMTLAINVVNLTGDVALIHGVWGAPRMGVEGAACASVLANVAGALLGAVILAGRYRAYLKLRGALDLSNARRLIATNFHLFGRTLCLLFAQFYLLRTVSGLGEVALAAHAVLWQVWSLVSYGVDGFAHAAETLVGNALGSRKAAEAVALARRCMVWGVALGGLCGVVFYFGLADIGALFTDHVDVVAQVASLAVLLSLTQPINGLVYVLDGVLIGANDVGYLFVAMVAVAFGVFLPTVTWIGPVWPGLWGAWTAYSVLMVGRFFVLYGRFRGRRWVRFLAT
ncbi:MAG: hypothetical protein CME26_06300 [Gemmatimonadetes bacterium]|nr:hypothetical protein [Gemmatimonadota bacterium]|tara:strand:- start:8296 stop:9627 length:1332 start_codon:yes stop_codon:yes gene_type:complete